MKKALHEYKTGDKLIVRNTSASSKSYIRKDKVFFDAEVLIVPSNAPTNMLLIVHGVLSDANDTKIVTALYGSTHLNGGDWKIVDFPELLRYRKEQRIKNKYD